MVLPLPSSISETKHFHEISLLPLERSWNFEEKRLVLGAVPTKPSETSAEKFVIFKKKSCKTSDKEGITNIQLLEDLSLSLLYQMFCNFFFQKLQIFRPTSRACETIGLIGTAPKTSLFSSKFHVFSNGNNKISWKCLFPEIELRNGKTRH